jgi:hypothetical protein
MLRVSAAPDRVIVTTRRSGARGCDNHAVAGKLEARYRPEIICARLGGRGLGLGLGGDLGAEQRMGVEPGPLARTLESDWM